MWYAENICRFTGILHNFSTKLVSDGQWLLGTGCIYLPDHENNNVGQYINIIAWQEVAERLEEVGNGHWVTIFGPYSPSTYNGKLNDTFLVNSVVIEQC